MNWHDWGAAQWILLAAFGVGLTGAAVWHGQAKKRETWNFYETSFWLGVQIAVLWWGGFWR